MEEVKIKTYGTREEVFQGLAKKTKGNLAKDDLIFENGRYKSKKAVEKGKALVSQLRGVKNETKQPLAEPDPEEPKAKDLTEPKVIKRTQRKSKPKKEIIVEQEEPQQETKVIKRTQRKPKQKIERIVLETIPESPSADEEEEE